MTRSEHRSRLKAQPAWLASRRSAHNRSSAGRTEDALRVRRRRLHDKWRPTPTATAHESSLSVITRPRTHFKKHRERKTARATRRFAFARGMRGPMANAEAGSSAQPAAGGQRDADRKALKGKEPQERRIDRERFGCDRGSADSDWPDRSRWCRTSPCAICC
jgi:hypothetical protein